MTWFEIIGNRFLGDFQVNQWKHRHMKYFQGLFIYLFEIYFSVASKSDKNLMTISNLGVCFGPTLLRPEEETMAAIMDIKFCNVVVEIMIENYDQVSTVDDQIKLMINLVWSRPFHHLMLTKNSNF